MRTDTWELPALLCQRTWTLSSVCSIEKLRARAIFQHTERYCKRDDLGLAIFIHHRLSICSCVSSLLFVPSHPFSFQIVPFRFNAFLSLEVQPFVSFLGVSSPSVLFLSLSCQIYPFVSIHVSCCESWLPQQLSLLDWSLKFASRRHRGKNCEHRLMSFQNKDPAQAPTKFKMNERKPLMSFEGSCPALGPQNKDPTKKVPQRP